MAGTRTKCWSNGWSGATRGLDGHRPFMFASDGKRRLDEVVESLAAEGWYKDPYRKHDDRWFSDGKPTSLVRDGRIESRDPPPDTPLPMRLVRSETSNQASDGNDLLRADDAEREPPYDRDKAVEEELDTLTLWGPD